MKALSLFCCRPGGLGTFATVVLEHFSAISVFRTVVTCTPSDLSGARFPEPNSPGSHRAAATQIQCTKECGGELATEKHTGA